MKRIKYIFLNVVLSLQLIFASIEIPEDSFVRAGSASLSGNEGYRIFEVTTTKSADSVRSAESKDSDGAAPKSKKQKTEELGLEVKNIELPYKLVADPGYDQTFKRIFDCTIDKISGQNRLMSLLNSILFPEAGENDLKIRKLESLPNEATNLGSKTPLGVLKYDIACRCTCYANDHINEVKIVNVEMQTGPQFGLQNRLIDYGNKLRSTNDSVPTIVLTFLNYYPKYHTRGDESAWLGLFYRDIKTGNPIKPLNEVLDTYCVDLSEESVMLKNDTPIFIGGKCINNRTGKEWLKLLGIRQWATAENKKYIIPYTATDPEVKNAIEILSCITEEELNSLLREEKEAYAIVSRAQEEGKIETAKNMLQMELLTPDNIALATGLPIEQINALKDELEKSKEDNELEEEDDE